MFRLATLGLVSLGICCACAAQRKIDSPHAALHLAIEHCSAKIAASDRRDPFRWAVVEQQDRYLVTYHVARPFGSERIGDIVAIQAEILRDGTIDCGVIIKAPTRLPDDAVQGVTPISSDPNIGAPDR